MAPDYILIHKSIASSFISCLLKSIKELFGENPQESSHYCRIINDRHVARLEDIISSQKKSNPQTIIHGGRTDLADSYFEPTVLEGVEMDQETNPVMKDEIFGPILPVIEVDNVDEAISYVNSR